MPLWMVGGRGVAVPHPRIQKVHFEGSKGVLGCRLPGLLRYAFGEK
jgi:hypothetical protein